MKEAPVTVNVMSVLTSDYEFVYSYETLGSRDNDTFGPGSSSILLRAHVKLGGFLSSISGKSAQPSRRA